VGPADRVEIAVTRNPSRYCRSCGAQVPPTGKFCPSCGSSFNLKAPYPAPDRDARDVDPRDPSPPRQAVAWREPDSRPVQGVVTPTVGGSVRMGFGIACGMLLFGLVVAAIVLVVIAMAGGLITWPFAQPGQRFEGVGPADSTLLALEGEYVMGWTATPTTPSACGFSAAIRSQSDSTLNVELAHARVEASPTPTGHRTIDLPPKPDYYLHVESDCRWSMRLARP
jgi:hypothetical protein